MSSRPAAAFRHDPPSASHTPPLSSRGAWRPGNLPIHARFSPDWLVAMRLATTMAMCRAAALPGAHIPLVRHNPWVCC